jgi:hypothetical protein
MVWFPAPAAAVIGHLSSTRGGPSSSLLAHQGGWDEMLMVAVPIAIFAALLRAANRRAARLEADRTANGTSAADQDPEPEPRNERAGPL